MTVCRATGKSYRLLVPDNGKPWFEEDAARVAQAIVGTVRRIREYQASALHVDLVHAGLHGGIPIAGLGVKVPTDKRPGATAVSLNVVRNMVSAVTSKIAAKNKPKPMFLPVEGEIEDAYEKRQQAEQLERFVDGVFYESKLYAKLTQVFRHGCVLGTGALKIYDEGGKVRVDPIVKTEIVVDDYEGQYGSPPNIYTTKYYDRRYAKKQWAKGDRADELGAAIDRCPHEPDALDDVVQSTADQVCVYEAWHEGEDEDTKGRHVVCIDGAWFVDEEWEGPPPFAFFHWAEPLVGFWGTGLAEELRGIQDEINKLLADIQKAHHLVKGHYLVQHGADMSTSHVNNDLASIVKYKGTPPTYVAPITIAPDIYAHLDRLYAKAYEICGISQLSATGLKPAGLDSGAAQRTYNDIQTERFLEVGQAYEELVVEAARQVIRCAKRIGGSYKVQAVGKKGISLIDWAEIDLAEDEYAIRVHPTSMLPSTPAGRLAWAQDMINSGAIPPEDVLDIVDFPDTEAYAKRRNAPRKTIERNIATMLRTGEQVTPEPFDNHVLALRLVNEAYHEARNDGVPDEKLELLRTYMSLTQKMMPPPPAPAPPMPPPGPPMGPDMGVPPMPPGPPMPPEMGVPPGLAA